jgi:hypothetical protein
VAERGISWDTCEVDGCLGTCLLTGAKCWAHASEPDLTTALERLSDDGSLDARGVSITEALLARLRAAAPHDKPDGGIHEGRRLPPGDVRVSGRFHRAGFQRPH